MKNKSVKHKHKSQNQSDLPGLVAEKKTIYWLAAILIITFMAYSSALQNQFQINWDDQKYVIENPTIRNLSIDNIKTFFSEYYMGNYHPLSMLSLAINYHFNELSPMFYHFTNILLHLINTLLVFLLIRHLVKDIEIALITAALFGLHTLHVESVAWVS